ncbi:MAG: hypothetical protein KBC58_08650 [Flavobacterium sp.]|nr:hypothetical protein [Flavobacterium sp.]
MKINKYILLAFASLALFSCDDDTLEDVRNAKPVISIDKNSITVSEDSEITFTATISQELANPSDLKLEYAGGTASFRDYEVTDFNDGAAHETTISEGGFGKGSIGHVIVFPALTKTATFKIKPVKDAYLERNEVLRITLKSTGNMLTTVDPASSSIAININDIVSNDIGAELVWAQNTTDVHGTIIDGVYIGTDDEEHAYADYDFDMKILNSSFADVSGGAGATESSPEFCEMLGSRPDGDYYVYAELYAAGAAPKVAFNKELTLNLTKFGVWGTSVKVPFNSDESFADVIAIITKTGNNYVVTNYATSEVIASGRTASLKSKIQAAIGNRRK